MKVDANGFMLFNTDDIPSLLVTLLLNGILVWLSFLVSRALWKKDKFGAGLISVARVGVFLLRVFLDVGMYHYIRNWPRSIPESARSAQAG